MVKKNLTTKRCSLRPKIMQFQASLNRSFMGKDTQIENQVTVPDEFHSDETLLTSHKTPFFSLLAMSAKLMIFKKSSMKPLSRLALVQKFNDRSCQFNLTMFTNMTSNTMLILKNVYKIDFNMKHNNYNNQIKWNMIHIYFNFNSTKKYKI